MLILGSYKHQLDQKGRMRVPSKFKSLLGDGFIVTKGINGCLFAFSKNEAETEIFNKFKSLPLFDEKAQKAVRLLFSSAFETEEDNQGRVLLPQELRSYASIEKNIVFVGAGERVEIWSESAWKSYCGEVNFDQTVSELKNYGV